MRNDIRTTGPYAGDMNYSALSVSDLLKTHTGVLDELRARGILRSANNPTGDYAEWLFCQALGWDQAANSVKGFDATDASGVRYQITAVMMCRQGSIKRPLSVWTLTPKSRGTTR